MDLIDQSRQNSSTSRLAYAPGATEQHGLGHVPFFHSIFQRFGNVLLTYDGLKALRSIFPCRYCVRSFHFSKIVRTFATLKIH